MLTYKLFKIQSMLLSVTTRKGQPYANLQAFEQPEHILFSNNQEGLPDADLHPVHNPEHALFSNQEKGPARC